MRKLHATRYRGKTRAGRTRVMATHTRHVAPASNAMAIPPKPHVANAVSVWRADMPAAQLSTPVVIARVSETLAQ